MVLVVLEHILVLLRKQLELLLVELLLRCGGISLLILRRAAPIINLCALGPVHAAKVSSSRHGASSLVQHALALLHLPREPNLHHGALEAPAFLQCPLQVPYYALSVRLDGVDLGLLRFLVGTLRCDGTACCPPSQSAQTPLCTLFVRNGALRLLPHLLSILQSCDGKVEVAKQLLRRSVHFVSLGIGEVLGVLICR
jgi:hypothetical protein